ncbi:CopG family transcriptional regulator [Caldicellulosiruptoraceae bacterium PP1]
MNKTTTVRIDNITYENLKKLSIQLNEPMHKIINEALKNYQKKLIIENTAKAYQELKNNNKLWQDELEERKLWDNTLYDLENE